MGQSRRPKSGCGLQVYRQSAGKPVTGWDGVPVGWQLLEEQEGVLFLHTKDILL